MNLSLLSLLASVALALAKPPRAPEKVLDRSEVIIPPFQVTDFAINADIERYENQYWYFVEGHIQLKPSEGQADCWGWKTITAPNWINESMPNTPCPGDQSISVALDVPTENQGTYSKYYTYIVIWQQSSHSTLQGYYNIDSSQFERTDQNGTEIMWYTGVRNFEIPVTQLVS